MGHETKDVFGISRTPIKSYVEREPVDGALQRAVQQSDNHIVIYGSSKQGKTALRQKHIPENKCIVFSCGPKSTTEDIYSSIIRQAAIPIETFQTTTASTTGTASAKTGFRALLPWIGGADAEAEGTVERGKQIVMHTEFVSFNFGEAQSMGELLVKTGFTKIVVLENFHYLSPETQRDIAFDLKAFHEIGVRFLILGVWKEANLLLMLNGDLLDRVTEVPVEPWATSDFDRVTEKGSELLNIAITNSITIRLKENAYGNVGLFQEFLKTFCLMCGIEKSAKELVFLDDQDMVNRVFDDRLESQKGQLVRCLQGLAAHSRVRKNEEGLLLPYYLVRVILSSPIPHLERGLEKNELLNALRRIHHRDDKFNIRGSDVTNLLQRLPQYQENMRPPLLHYDVNARRLRIVDTRHFFVLANASRLEIEEEIPLPKDMSDDPPFV